MDQTKLDAIGNQYSSVLDTTGSGNILGFDMADQDVPLNPQYRQTIKGNPHMIATHQRYAGVFGFNTKQWWVYDEDDDVYIDPPISVLRKIKTQNNNHEIEQKRLEKIANKKCHRLRMKN